MPIKEAITDLTVESISRAGSTTVRYKLNQFAGERPQASLKSTIESELMTLVIESVVRYTFDNVFDAGTPRSRRYRSE
jgi:hypothetical protein